MKDTLAFLLVNGVIAIAHCIAAGTFLVLGKTLLWLAPYLAESILAWLLLGSISVGAGIWFTIAAARAPQAWAQVRRKGY